MIKCARLLFLFVLLAAKPGVGMAGATKPVYLLIVADKYAGNAALQQFVDFRNAEFSVQTATASAIGATKDDYREFIRNLMPDYVLLVGNYGDFPEHRIVYPAATIESYNYYVASSLSGHPAPDIPLGLFFAENETELENIIRKTISYETNLISYPKHYYAHAGSVEPLPPWPVVEFNEEILTEMNDSYFSKNGYEFTLATANDDTPNDRWTDVSMINNGIHFMIYHGHGNINRWSFGLGVPGLTQLNNTIYPVVLSFACLTGTFSGVAEQETGDCLAQKMVAHQHGAVAFLGSYNISGRGMNLLMKGMVNGFFNDSVTNRLGDAMIYGFANTTNAATVDAYYPTVTAIERIRAAWQFHLFGDPALRINPTAIPSKENQQYSHEWVSLHPNPVRDRLKIQTMGNYNELEFTLYSLDGRLVSTVKNQTEICLINLNPGYHIAKTKLDGIQSTFSIMKIQD